MNAKFRLPALLFLLLTASCEEKVGQQVNIYIQNKTSFKAEVELYPASGYRGNIGNQPAYRISSTGGGYRYANFAIDTGISENIFCNNGFSESAAVITRKVFEKIKVTLEDDRKTRIHFYHDSASGYKTNIFSDDAVWIFSSYLMNFPTMFRSHPTELHDYYFVITEDNLIGK